MSVDLPEPLGPRMQTCSPTAMRRERPSRATFWPRRTVMFCRSRSGGVIGESLPCRGGETEQASWSTGRRGGCSESPGAEALSEHERMSELKLRSPKRFRTKQSVTSFGTKKGGENVNLRLPGWGGCCGQSPWRRKQQRLPCQAGLRSHSRNSTCYYVRRLTTSGLVFRIY